MCAVCSRYKCCHDMCDLCYRYKQCDAMCALCYRYKRCEERAVMDNAMKCIMPLLYQRIVQMMPDPSDISVLLQKQILKIFYAFVQVGFLLF